MNKVNYRAAIEGPVKYAGATIDQKLVETLLNDIGDQTDQLPVLQHCPDENMGSLAGALMNPTDR